MQQGGRVGLGLVLPLALAIGWEIAIDTGLVSGRLLPPPSRIGATLLDLAASGDLLMHVQATLIRVGLGFLWGAAVGILAGGLVATLPTLRWLLDPSLQALRAVPSLAWVPLFILWFGILETPKVLLIAVGVFFPVYVGVSGAIASVDRKLIEVGRIFQLSRFGLARRILLPAVLLATLVGLRPELGLGFLFVVAAELMGASEGLGYLLVDGQQFGKPDQIVAAIIAFAAAGKLADLVLMTLTRPLTRWQDTERESL
ncbi:ABC transporter permease [Methylobacterium sp. J-001]|uniref:ABC transporter permease n=1 Tax=Methylobacterium sp. J-001 TaxID=2836609 RepID=UPI001FB96FE1|nr:ABC transporter permease [Methylobacterium sp. J-001]MCJ2115225.1 ABC transporter permease [Methylobacterium sp. J-001]